MGKKVLIPPRRGYSFYAWKKASAGGATRSVIVKLRIPARAGRTRYSKGGKQRAEYAIVERIEYLRGTKNHTELVAYSDHDRHFTYRVGQKVWAQKHGGYVGWVPMYRLDVDCGEWSGRRCQAGIHFFMTRAEAVAW